MERGNQMQRRLDSWVGIPLVALAGGAKRFRNLVAPPRFAAESAGRVGVICLGAIGDLLLATGLLAGLRRALPHASIEILTSKANAATRGLLPPECRTVSFGVKDIPGIVQHLRAARYDILIDTGQWPRISALVAAASGARCTVGFATPGQYRHYAYDVAVPHRSDRHEVANFLALGQALFPDLAGSPVVAIPESPSPACPALPEAGVVFCHMWPSGLRSHLKEWPREYWAELGTALRAGGYTPVFTGGPGDAAATTAFLEASGLGSVDGRGGALSVAGAISLPDLAYHMRRAAAVVSVNTGTMHLAAIAGAPTVGLHGPTNPLRWGPVGPKTVSLLPRSGHSAYLNLGFEYPPDAEGVLRHLPVADVVAALRGFGLSV
ncbi:Glycosyl transferase family 9 [uncultured delta proteobacterium]|uniref:Glycosyl transferase family 9 n=1 Tax=uncultured delta proteobacterium TaxID=34034 RepID=A0A212IUC5_9DELT|nr:Glycosyl transferase family 9 [uncultured delta proteobacterium]